MARRDARTLRDDATRAAAEGKHKRAIECYLELEQLEPYEPNWPKRAAETYRRIDRSREAVAAYERAIERYVAGGFMVQAIAVCKIILSIDPAHDSAKRRLAAISEQQDGARSQAGVLADRHQSLHGLPVVDLLRASGEAPVAPPPRTRSVTMPPAVTFTPPPPPEQVDVEAPEFVLPSSELEVIDDRDRSSGSITIDRGAPLDSVDLAAVMPGAQPAYTDGESAGIIVIPIDDGPLDDGPFDDGRFDGSSPSVEIVPMTDDAPDSEAGIEVEVAGDPEELSLDDLEEVPLLAEPRPYSAAARRALSATPLFASLAPGALESLIDRLTLVDLIPGEVLFRQGDPGTALYVVVDGEVAVVSEGPPRLEVSRLGAGAFFGEVALVTEQPRSATIEATAATQLLAIDRDVIAGLVSEHADVLPVILRFLRERLVDRLVRTHPLFEPFADADRRMLVSRWRFLEIEPGTTITQQGVKAQGLYALLAGRADVLHDGAVIAALGPGELFGETSLLTGSPCRITVRSRPKCLALCLPAADFREIIMTHPQVLSYIGELVDERERTLSAQLSPSARAKMV